MATVVLTLAGFNAKSFGDITVKALNGYAGRNGRRQCIVDYPQSSDAESFSVGCSSLNTAIRDSIAAGHTVEILAHSMGAEVVGDWLEKYAGRPDAPTTAQLTRIILIGNPARRMGGYMGFRFGGTRRKPTPETQYRTDDIARRKDPWANADNYPDKLTLSVKMRMALARMTGIGSDHMDYSKVDPATSSVRGESRRTTYWLAA